jgi:NADPH:quinone reductase-like Zn-dependent oxidoreductase
MARLTEWLGKKTLNPLISARHALAQGAEAIRDVRERRAVGKVVVLP